MSAERRVVAHRNAIFDDAIMRNMRPFHEVPIIAD
jgi:hypothetical protein